MKPFSLFVPILVYLLCTPLNHALSADPSAEQIDENYHIRLDRPFLVEIKMDAGRLSVQKNQAAATATISLRYDDRLDEIDVEYNEQRNELSLIIDRRKWLHSHEDNAGPRLKLLLPTAAVIKIDASVKAGEVEFILDSLKIGDFELQSLASKVEVDFSSPNRAEMQLLDIDLKIGQARLRHLGNARFREARINGGIGDLEMDFYGSCLASATADIDLDIGETQIYLPRDLGVRLHSSTAGFLSHSRLDFNFDKKGRFYLSENYQNSRYKLDLSIRAGIGELSVLYR